MSGGRLRGETRVAAVTGGTALAVLASLLVDTTATAASTVALSSDLPTTPVQVAVGDVITMTLPPAVFTPPTGYSGPGSMSYPLPTSSDSTVLARVSGTHDAGGTMHASFQAAQAGTATISQPNPSPVWCATTTTTSSSSTTTSHATSSFAAVVAAPSTTTTTTTESTATPSPSPTQCIAADPTVPRTVSVIVSATGVQSAVTVPSTGSHGSPAAGLVIAVAGTLAATLSLLLLRRDRRRRSG